MNNQDILKLRILLSFLRSSPENCTVTGFSRILNVPKYTVSRMLAALEQEGLVDRGGGRNLALTEPGLRRAHHYAQRMEAVTRHLMYEGVDPNNAREDAFCIALYASEQTLAAIRATEATYCLKDRFARRHRFSGSALCAALKDGVYHYPFVFYRVHARNRSNLSMANRGFRQPCALTVKHGKGTLSLSAVEMVVSVANQSCCGKIQDMQYFDNGRYVDAEVNGDIFSLPASALAFTNFGTGASSVLQGTVYLQLNSSGRDPRIPASEAIFTLLI